MIQRKMRRMTLLILLIVCVATLVPFAFSRPSEDARQEINKTFDQYVQGWRKGDVKLLSEVYANDAKVSAYWPDPSRPNLLMGWPKISSNLKDIFERLHEISPYGMDLEFNERNIDLYGDTAVLTSSWVWGHPADPAFGTGRATFIFQHRGKKWFIVHEHSSVTPFDSK